MEDRKKCTGCGQLKPYDEFYFNSQRRDWKSHCIPCDTAKRRQRYRNNHEVEKQKARERAREKAKQIQK